jgi:hypothetical protein
MSDLKTLFKTAEKEGGLEYIYTLVRVEGITYKKKDALIELRMLIENLSDTIADDEIIEKYKECAKYKEPFNMLANLVNCATNKPYKFLPFFHLRKGTFPRIQEAAIPEILQEILPLLNKAGYSDITSKIQKAYHVDFLSNRSEIAVAEAKNILKELKSFLVEFLNIYFQDRMEFRKRPKFYKLPRFDVLELLTSEESGLYGFSVHFSNGSSATFVREIDRTECVNITLGETLDFQVGLLDEMTNRWKVKDKYLYEIGLPGRYNKPGEWRPIEYPKGSEEIDKEIRDRTQDFLVQGCLFYIMTTCHQVIEFVVKTNINIPHEEFSFGDKFHLYKCSYIGNTQHTENNYYIYDGWLELDSIDPEYIRSAIATIGIGVNRMAFAYNGKVDWRLKYHNKPLSVVCAVPSNKDLDILDTMFRKFPVSEDSIFLDAAIEWFNRGRSSQNSYVSFLCYYFSFELLAIAIAEGDANFNFARGKVDKKNIEKEKIKCIEEKLEALYETNPIEFIENAYHDCVRSLRKKTQEVSELVFGKDHKYVKSLFEKQEGYSLNDLRGAIAHGVSGLVNSDIEQVVEKRCHELANIVKSFLTRIIFGLKPDEDLPRWSGQHMVSMQTNDPRGAHVVSDLKILPNTDWRIHPAWVEER